MRIIIPAALLIYAFAIYWLFRHVQFKQIWDDGKAAISLSESRLTKVVKRVLDVALLFILAILILWLPIVIIMGISQTQIPNWGIDIAVFSGFSINLSGLSGVAFEGLRHPEISGKTMVNLDTSNLFAWYLFAIFQQVSAAITLYVLVQIRAVVISTLKGNSFEQENGDRIKHVGVVILMWNIVMPFFQYFGWGAVVKQVTISPSNIQLFPAFELNPVGILIGLLLYLLAKMLREAAAMRAEQELTI